MNQKRIRTRKRKKLEFKVERWPLCNRCGVEFEPQRINRKGHCPACADELMEDHPFTMS